MQPLTTREGTGYVLSPERYDAGVNRLGALERMWADLEARQAAIPGELQALREALERPRAGEPAVRPLEEDKK